MPKRSSSSKGASSAARSISKAAAGLGRSVGKAAKSSSKAPRAPAGAAKAAAGLARFVKVYGKAAAADAYGTSVGNVSKVINARAAGKLAHAFSSANVLKGWQTREKAARGLVGRSARKVIDGKGPAPKRAPAPAKTKAGKVGQAVAGKISATRTDKAMAEQLGISRQKATAERLALSSGKASPETAKRWADADKKLGKTLLLKDGMIIASKSHAKKYTAKSQGKNRAVSRRKKFRTLKQAKEWIDNIAAGRSYFRIVNKGTPERPRYDVLFGDEKALAEIDAAAGFDLDAMYQADEGDE